MKTYNSFRQECSHKGYNIHIKNPRSLKYCLTFRQYHATLSAKKYSKGCEKDISSSPTDCIESDAPAASVVIGTAR